MANAFRASVLDSITSELGPLKKVAGSNSLVSFGDDVGRIYFRYSRLHSRGRAFYGLREVDLRQLEGRNSFICFYSDDSSSPTVVPYADFEEIFHSTKPASDGQYKVQIIAAGGTKELYVPGQGRFNVDGYVGTEALNRTLPDPRRSSLPPLSHCQVQTLVGSIGHLKGYDVFVPASNVCSLDWTLSSRFPLIRSLPAGYQSIAGILGEIDVIWVKSGTSKVEALFEVEHSTPVYSGLLRFNDVLLTDRSVSRFFVVSNDMRRALFARQLARPTFRRSGLSELTSFLEYANVFDWHSRLAGDLDGN